MKTLSTEHRRLLERTVIEARDIAEAGARGALEALAVHHHEPYSHMSGEQRKLRKRLRAHARHLGDGVDARSGAHAIDHLVHECAYEHWHGMLFARFLAENHLLIEPEMGVAITLDECEELAKEEGVDKWALGSRFAHRMLPQVFRPDHPVFEVQLAREYRLKLEDLVEGLPVDVLTATDSLGWVYQFWQTKRKDEVNRSEVKIGADELPAVTQLFTEPYMVQFLLHNSLGAWWVSRHPDKACPADLAYLRRTEDGSLAAGAFEGWPDDLAEFRLLDPCCGSGHFLVAAFLMLVPMRMELERLDAAAAVDAVLRENIHGLELDQRCVAIAAFALALEAWRFPDAGGFRTLPKLNLAWCGQPVGGKKEQWLALAEGDSRLEAGMAALYDTFRDAPTLGSLIDPARSVAEDMLTAGFDQLQPLLEKALREHAGEEEWEETVIAAKGLTHAASMLSSNYQLVVTNVPYLSRSRQSTRLIKCSDDRFPRGKNELAYAFLERILALVAECGVVTVVLPQNFLYMHRYTTFREWLLREFQWKLIARLGARAFETISGEVVNAGLFILGNDRPQQDTEVQGFDLPTDLDYGEKAEYLCTGKLESVGQLRILELPDSVFSFSIDPKSIQLLEEFAECYQGLRTGDAGRFVREFWEVNRIGTTWEYFQTSGDSEDTVFTGYTSIIRWEAGLGQLAEYARETREKLHDMHESGNRAWGRVGVAIGQITLRSTAYLGEKFDNPLAVIVPRDGSDLLPIWGFVNDSSYKELIKERNRGLYVTNAALLKVPFDIDTWRQQARSLYRNGLPRAESNDPTQWIFHGHPTSAGTPLQVAVLRLLGYRWPAENDSKMELSDEQRTWIDNAKALYPFEDDDGIVCISSVRGERPSSERLLQLLHAAYGDNWHDGVLTKLLAESGSASLDDWLRNKFFEAHCKLFHHRPFIWHIWDGRKRDGFHALVNYHKLADGDGKGRRLLESLTYSYLGDWINRQQDGVKRADGGAEDRLAAAIELQKRLVAILEGEPPFDIFARWKPIEEQPIGWEPDINDGVRLNIRPFMAQDLPGGKKGAGILRAKPNIHWKKDRGKEPTRDQEQFPWFWGNGKFTGERVNDIHLRITEKRTARDQAGGDI
ncbi:MAG: BREX-1 system adenine-specific DNA-methyltransferase PglX [Candidatus Thiodiazotropha endolucinida]|nr:BREX-1 system adenine-specific DNA-methyltransferase PglX [Candidatus Thiodiazotropha taylori]MCG8060528.1 BREX-1 system adenine-specific DNA-methyltransferase PglX [Candidatus Thiodiazotropha taylori]MCW4345254.1 BREX-1 system adenine-specific DNA-methyltransferase PglX [Candidatus Thiodiazotropha endolucinida]MCW4349655.1 BREX-1 system adenine-specific DNA-methyltransferase PglX [Candidatus Thiodiazotropha endolucinida]